MWRRILTTFAAMLFLPAVVAVAYFSWWAGREINYRWQYEDMVQQTVREMVKEEALR